MENVYDILVIGGGPAGITAGIYAKRAGKKVAVFEKFVPGGQVAQIGEIENYTGYDKIMGADLAQVFYDHAKKLKVPFIFEEVIKARLSSKTKTLYTKKNVYKAKAVILALGCKTRELNITGEQKFKGQGVSYCATCDGNFFKDKNVAVIGSGDSAMSDTIYLSNICKQVYMLTKDQLKLHNYSENEVKKLKNVKLLKGSMSAEIVGKDKVEGLKYKQDDKTKTLKVDGVFVAIGRTPDTQFLGNQLELSPRGYIKVDKNYQTSIEGVYACGDVVDGSICQIVTATGEGALTATKAIVYLAKQKALKK